MRGGREEDKCWEGAEEGSIDDGLVECKTVVIVVVGGVKVWGRRGRGD